MSCTAPKASYVAGDTYPFICRAKIDGAPFPIDLASVVDATWIDADGTAITASVGQPSSATGANWGQGVIAVAFPQLESDKLIPFAGSTVTLEIRISAPAGVQTLSAPYTIRRRRA